MTNTIETVATEQSAQDGQTVFVPLNKLKKSPKNVRKVPHTDEFIAALAASVAAKGLYQNLVVEPEVKNGKPTGCYLVTAGEGRRLAYLLRAKRKEIRKNHLVRCWLDTENDPAEVSLDENYNREQLHPADQFERFHELSRDKGWGAEGGFQVPDARESAPQVHFESLEKRGGKQRPGRRTRSIRGWTVPTLDPQLDPSNEA